MVTAVLWDAPLQWRRPEARDNREALTKSSARWGSWLEGEAWGQILEKKWKFFYLKSQLPVDCALR